MACRTTASMGLVMAFEIDPVKYGVLWQKVEDYERKFDSMEKKIDAMDNDVKKLVAMAERSKGSLWALMGVASVVGGAVTWISDIFMKR
jgi:wobble nucleotide-excising tRNase